MSKFDKFNPYDAHENPEKSNSKKEYRDILSILGTMVSNHKLLYDEINKVSSPEKNKTNDKLKDIITSIMALKELFK